MKFTLLKSCANPDFSPETNASIKLVFFVSSCSNHLKAVRTTSLADENLLDFTCPLMKLSKQSPSKIDVF
jgi:hypothetical protein